MKHNVCYSSLSKNLVLVFLAFSMVLFSACSSTEKPGADTLVLTVDDSKVYRSEMMYHVMLARMQGELYASFVGKGEAYWNMKNDNGTSMREAVKDMAMDNAIKYELFYQKAVKKGYSLTEEEKRQSREKARSIVTNISKEALSRLGLTEEMLESIQEKITLAAKYYEDYIKDLVVDEKDIKLDVKKEDFKQYDIEYIYGDMNHKKDLEDLLKTSEKAADFTKLEKKEGLHSGKLSFLAGQDTFGKEENLEGIITSMKPGEVQGIIETVKGYYIIKLVDNTSAKKYEEAVKKAEEDARDKAFQTAFERMKKEHKITIAKKAWNSVTVEDGILKIAKGNERIEQ